MAIDAIEDTVGSKASMLGLDQSEKEHLDHLGPNHITVRVHNASVKNFPNCALMTVKAGLARENLGTLKLQVLSGEVKKKLANIDLLLELNTELTSLNDKDSYKLTPKMLSVIEKLKASGIEVWKEGDTMKKEQLAELKAQVSSQIDKLRTSLQTTVSTEIQPETNNLHAIMNIIRQIIESDARLKKKTTELPR